MPIENYDQVKIEIPPDLYFFLGKNITQEKEILVASFVSENYITGRVIFRIWPPERWGRVQ